MKKYNITVIEGDGIGPEVIGESLKILDIIKNMYDFDVAIDKQLMGGVAIDETGEPLPQNTLESCINSDAILFGAIGDPKYDNNPKSKVRPEQGLLRLRKELKLYANIRPVKAYNSLISRSPLKKEIVENTDFVIFRELINGIYFGEQNLNLEEGFASDTCNYTEKDITSIAHLAFETAKKRKGKVTLVDKANVLATSRLWRHVCTEISTKYPDVVFETLYVDNAAMKLITNPTQFDVILTENLFGDILSDEASVLTSSIGMMPSSSIGENNALFEPIHGSYPQAKGKNIANPIGSILSVAMMLEHFGENEAAKTIEDAVEFLVEDSYLTPDLNSDSNYSTSDIGEALSNVIHKIHDNEWYYDKTNINIGRSTII